MALIQQGAESVKGALEMLAHIDRIASCSWWRFVGWTSTTSQDALLGWDLVTVGAIL